MLIRIHRHWFYIDPCLFQAESLEMEVDNGEPPQLVVGSGQINHHTMNNDSAPVEEEEEVVAVGGVKRRPSAGSPQVSNAVIATTNGQTPAKRFRPENGGGSGDHVQL